MKRRYTLRAAAEKSALMGAAAFAALLSQAGTGATDAPMSDDSPALQTPESQVIGGPQTAAGQAAAEEARIWRAQACYVHGDQPKCYVHGDRPKCYVHGDQPKCYVHR